MTLSAYFAQIDPPTRTVTIYAPQPQPDVVDWFQTGVDAVDYRSLPDVTAASQSFFVIHEDDAFVAAIGLEAAREFLEPPINEPWADALDDASYRRLVEVFESTVWHSLERRQLLAVSREIENRAWRAGSGTLRVGFQNSDALEPMEAVYARLAAESALDIHVYIADDWDRPSIPGVTIYADGGDEIGSFWVLTFDGDGDPLRTSGLIARERDADGFEGLWTDDTQLVARLERALQAASD
ncbi:DICT sensory domain-containing protein [Natronorubrum thiooxidans]|uniref:Diguanylate Cyclase and Two-component system sensory domain-containing protein n=1 Tax=Natronorubrum thiooxidans TaxID=308853 RepID=A0A1N7D808_9EURY|nr:DICT sensory domain-containing protein [Natronorubrum thiooxidans]SIR71951.1 Diguanylate Cyclase and Two-component system sensory domain-containing protein [Natronorubrum thiooxidans]